MYLKYVHFGELFAPDVYFGSKSKPLEKIVLIGSTGFEDRPYWQHLHY